jgi:hypothetical protein
MISWWPRPQAHMGHQYRNQRQATANRVKTRARARQATATPFSFGAGYGFAFRETSVHPHVKPSKMLPGHAMAISQSDDIAEWEVAHILATVACSPGLTRWGVPAPPVVYLQRGALPG